MKKIFTFLFFISLFFVFLIGCQQPTTETKTVTSSSGTSAGTPTKPEYPYPMDKAKDVQPYQIKMLRWSTVQDVNAKDLIDLIGANNISLKDLLGSGSTQVDMTGDHYKDGIVKQWTEYLSALESFNMKDDMYFDVCLGIVDATNDEMLLTYNPPAVYHIKAIKESLPIVEVDISEVLKNFYQTSGTSVGGFNPITGNSFMLENDKIYVWKVVVTNGNGVKVESPLWQFKTAKTNAPVLVSTYSDFMNNPNIAPQNNSYAGNVSQVNLKLPPQIVQDPDGDNIYYELFFGQLPNSMKSLGNVLFDANNGAFVDVTADNNYFWYVVAKDTNGGQIKLPTLNFTTKYHANTAPIFKNPLLSPVNGDQTADRNVNLTFTWQLASDNESNALTYVFYYGTDTSNLIMNTVPAINIDKIGTYTINANTLAYNTTYLWKVDVIDSYGLRTASPVWSFKTKANQAPIFTNPLIYPVNGDQTADTTPTLNWRIATDNEGETLSYTLYYGKDINKLTMVTGGFTISGTLVSYTLPVLDNYSTYFWKVEVKDAYGLMTSSATWSFKTKVSIPTDPSVPIPASGSTAITTKQVLEWTGSTDGNNVVIYDVYIGTNTTFTSPVTSDITVKYFKPTLAVNTTYYWKVVAKNNFGGKAESPIWNFRTESSQTSFFTDFKFATGQDETNYGFTKTNGAFDNSLGYPYPSLTLTNSTGNIKNTTASNLFSQSEVEFDVRIGNADNYEFDQHANLTTVSWYLDRFVNANNLANHIAPATCSRNLRYSTDYTDNLTAISSADRTFLYTANTYTVALDSTASINDLYTGATIQNYSVAIPKYIKYGTSNANDLTVSELVNDAGAGTTGAEDQAIFNACYDDIPTSTQTFNWTTPSAGSKDVIYYYRHYKLRTGLTNEQLTDLYYVLKRASGTYSMTAYANASPSSGAQTTDPATGTLLNSGDVVEGYMTASGASNSNPTTAGTYTFYRITVGAAADVYISLTSIPVGTDYDMALYDSIANVSSNTRMASSVVPSNADDRMEVNLPGAGTYYLKVYSYNGFSTTDTYRLTYFIKDVNPFVLTESFITNNSGSTTDDSFFQTYTHTYYTLKDFDAGTNPNMTYTAAQRNRARSILEQVYYTYYTDDTELKIKLTNSLATADTTYIKYSKDFPFEILFDVTMDCSKEQIYLWGSYIDDNFNPNNGGSRIKYTKTATTKNLGDWFKVKLTSTVNSTGGSYTVSIDGTPVITNFVYDKRTTTGGRIPSKVDNFIIENNIASGAGLSQIWIDNLSFKINDSGWLKSIFF
ncbi:MAG: hypothetical protein A2Y34_02130 [Spirochaetes bacterium GWC1_27_15]|nr:MAG: hypothetical protein A2Y34_02130 [Spirochaetes bacterium GWC1_27_15]